MNLRTATRDGAVALLAAVLGAAGGTATTASAAAGTQQSVPATAGHSGETTLLENVLVSLSPGETPGTGGTGTFSFSAGAASGAARCSEAGMARPCSVRGWGSRSGDMCSDAVLRGTAAFDDGDVWWFTMTFVGGRGVLGGTAYDADSRTTAPLRGVVAVPDSPASAAVNENDCVSEVLEQPADFITIDAIAAAGRG